MFVHYVQVGVKYLIKLLKAVLGPYILSSIHFAYFQLHLRHPIILWAGDSESKMAFKYKQG